MVDRNLQAVWKAPFDQIAPHNHSSRTLSFLLNLREI
jgi:hypothetical protein